MILDVWTAFIGLLTSQNVTPCPSVLIVIVGGFSYIFLVSTCETCRNIFAPALYIRKHIATHRGEIHLECELCGKTFHHADVPINHIGLHLGGSPFSNQKVLRHAVFMDR